MPFSSGHFASVNDLCWSVSGSDGATVGAYLTTVSSDQTCRIFAPLLPASEKAATDGSCGTASTAAATPAADTLLWKEISRPQIHGYDLNCVAMHQQQQYRQQQHQQTQYPLLYTAGEEKLIRVFDAPAAVLRGLQLLCGIGNGGRQDGGGSGGGHDESKWYNYYCVLNCDV